MKKKTKSHSGAKKRLGKTGTGKLKKNKVNKRHLLTSKGRNRKRGLAKANTVATVDTARLEKLVPYL